MTERKRDHVATIGTALVFVLMGAAYFTPVPLFMALTVLGALAVPLFIWLAIRSVL